MCELNDSSANRQFIITYIKLREWVGWLGLAFPFVLILGSLVFNGCTQIQPSISHYYYTIMGGYFVGTLCAIGMFMFAYRGYDKCDNITGNIAGVCAILVALFPTDCDPKSLCQFVMLSRQGTVEPIHYCTATMLFICLAYFCLSLFPKTDKLSKNEKGEIVDNRTPRKLKRNKLYRICGWVIVFSILSIAAIHFIPWLHNHLESCKTTLIFETTALVPFSISWLTKGEKILKDKK